MGKKAAFEKNRQQQIAQANRKHHSRRQQQPSHHQQQHQKAPFAGHAGKRVEPTSTSSAVARVRLATDASRQTQRPKANRNDRGGRGERGDGKQEELQPTVKVVASLPNAIELQQFWDQAYQSVRLPHVASRILQVLSAWTRKESLHLAHALTNKTDDDGGEAVTAALTQLWQFILRGSEEHKASTERVLASILIDESALRVILAVLDCWEAHNGNASSSDGGGSERSDLRAQFAQDVMKMIPAEEADDDSAAAAVSSTSSKSVVETSLPINLLELHRVRSFPQLALHHTGRLVVRALLKHGTQAQRKALNRILAPYCLRFADHRHGVQVLQDLLAYYPKSAKTIVPALVPFLSGLVADASGFSLAAAMVQPSQVPRILEALQTKEKDGDNNDEDDAAAPSLRLASLEALSKDKRGLRFLSQLLLNGLAHDAANADGLSQDDRMAALETLSAKVIVPNAARYATEERGGNGLLQDFVTTVAGIYKQQQAPSSDAAMNLIKAVMAAIFHQPSSSSSQPSAEKKKRRSKSEDDPSAAPAAATPNAQLLRLMSDRVGTHVVSCLARCNIPEINKFLIGAILPRIVQIATDRHSSLALRRLLSSASETAAVSKQQASAGNNKGAESLAEAFFTAIKQSQSVDAILTHESGNLVIQDGLRALPSAAARRAFFMESLKPRLSTYARHQFASHVIYCLLDSNNASNGGGMLLDANTHNEIFALLKGELVDLAQHLNGRFLVERFIIPFREARDILTNNFVKLAFCKGSHHVLVRLYETVATMDERPPTTPKQKPAPSPKQQAAGRKSAGGDASSAVIGGGPSKDKIARLIVSHLEGMATDQNGTLVLQKVLQSDILGQQAAQSQQQAPSSMPAAKAGSKRTSGAASEGQKSAKTAEAAAAASSAAVPTPVLAAIRQEFKSNGELVNRLRQDFFGRFVVDIVEASRN